MARVSGLGVLGLGVLGLGVLGLGVLGLGVLGLGVLAGAAPASAAARPGVAGAARRAAPPRPTAPEGLRGAQAARRLAVRAWQQGDAEATLRALRAPPRSAADGHPGDRARAVRIARALLEAAALERLGRLGEAQQRLEAAPTRGDMGAHVLDARARLHVRLGQPDAAVAVYHRLLRRPAGPLHGPARVARAEQLWLAGRHEAAARAYRALLRRYPHYPSPARWIHGEARALLLAGRPAEAARRWQRLRREHPVAPEAPAAARALAALAADPSLAETPSPAGDPSPARDPSQTQDLDHQLARARALGRSGELPEARSILERLVAQGRLPAAQARLLEARLLMRVYRYGPAAKLLLRLVEQGPARERAEARALLPRALARADRLDRLLALRRAERGPARRRWARLSRVHLLRGEYRQAEALLRRAGGAGAKSFLAAYLAYRVGDYARAARRLRALGRRPGLRRPARYWLARLDAARGRHGSATRRLRALARSPELDWYALMARARLRGAGERTEPAPRPLAPLSRSANPDLLRLARLLAGVAAGRPALGRAATLLGHGLRRRGMLELRVGARRYLLEQGGRRSRTLRPVTEAEAWQGVRHRATARGTDGPPRRRRPSASAPARRIEAALYHVFARLDAPYLANRFASRLEGRPRLRLARPFGRWVRARAPENGLSPGRLWAVMTVESAWCPRVVSSAGAVGLLQLMPITARRVARARGLRGFHLARLFEPATSIGFGAWYLGQLLRRFDGQYPLAVAAYNGGPHNVAAWVRRKAHRCALDELVEEIPFRETRLYVKKVTALAARYAIELGEPYADLLRLRVDATIGNNIDF